MLDDQLGGFARAPCLRSGVGSVQCVSMRMRQPRICEESRGPPVLVKAGEGLELCHCGAYLLAILNLEYTVAP